MKRLVFITLIITIIFFRFYNLNWGSSYYFHPDERNIANSIVQLNFSSQLNPHFFAYGSFPIYIIYFSGVLLNFLHFSRNISNSNVNFEEAIIISRFYSALFSLLLPVLFFYIGKKAFNKEVGIIAFLLGGLSIGFTQFAHFGTFEMWLTFFSTLLLFYSISYLKKQSKRVLILICIIIGLLIAIKVSSLIFLPLPFFLSLLKIKSNIKNVNFINFKKITYVCLISICYLGVIFLTSFIVSPFNILDYKDFKSSISYESSVALGNTLVFYTQEFLNTKIILYQLFHVLPFLLNPLECAIFIPSLIYCLFKVVKNKNQELAVIVLFFALTFFSQAFLFVKWVRYMVPSLSFIYLLTAYSISDLRLIFKEKAWLYNIIIYSTYLFCAIWVFAYFYTAFIKTDTRIEAMNFAKLNINEDASIYTESYDLGILPFNSPFRKIKLYDFYDLNNSYSNIIENISSADYLILPSQRILEPRILDPKEFNASGTFYSKLYNNKLNFKLIYETPCDFFCNLTYLFNPITSYEETASVFERPTIFIYQNQRSL